MYQIETLVCVLLLFQGNDAASVCQGDISTSCPTWCECNTEASGVLVDCTNRLLNDTPSTLPERTWKLSVSGHNVADLQPRSFTGCSNLIELDLSSGPLTTIDVDAFSGLDNLEILGLQENELNFSGDSIRLGTFDHLCRLRVLLLHDNNITDALNYKDQLFRNLTSLEELSLVGLPLAKLGSGFSKLTSLKSFKIIGGIRHIMNDTLENLKNLPIKYVQFGGEQLLNLDEMAFSHLPKLETLNLSHSYNLGFANMSKAWYSLRYTNISELVLSRSVPYDWEIITLEAEFFDGLNYTNITKLHLDKNNIVIIEPRFSECLPNLEWLSIAYHRLQLVKDLVIDLAKMQKLKYANANYQFKRKVERAVDEHMDSKLSNRQMLYLNKIGGKSDSGKIISFVEDDPDITAVSDTRKRHNPYIFKSTIKLTLPPKLETLLLSESLSLKWDEFPELIILGKTSIKYMDYSDNGLSRWFGPIAFNVYPPPQITLNLRNNGAYYVHADFNSIPKSSRLVQRLLLSGNKLGIPLRNDYGGILFRGLINLLELELSQNNIKFLPEKCFSHVPQLEVMDLSHNSLRLLNFDLSPMTNLTLLNFSSNIIAALDTQTMNDLDTISMQSENRTITLDLSENPLDCSCQSREFLEWVFLTPITLYNWRQYSCMFNKTVVSFEELKDNILPGLRVECAGHAWLIATTTSFCFLIFIVAVSVVIYRHRWEIKFFCVKLARDRKRYQQIEDEEEAYTWDAFVAYDHKDLHWVKQELLPHMETGGENNFNLCVHHRDFRAGIPIEENIVDHITKSRKVLLIVSRGFAESEWCKFEMRMTYGRCFDEGKDLIVAIMLENVPASLMNRPLQKVVSRNTYIEWPQNVNEKTDFWDKLREAMAASPVTQITCQCGRQVVTE